MDVKNREVFKAILKVKFRRPRFRSYNTKKYEGHIAYRENIKRKNKCPNAEIPKSISA